MTIKLEIFHFRIICYDKINNSSYNINGVLIQETASECTTQLFAQLKLKTDLAALIRSVINQVCKKLSPLTEQLYQDEEAAFNQQMVQLCMSNKQKDAVNICSEKVENIQRDGYSG